jgi:hypothetical protein
MSLEKNMSANYEYIILIGLEGDGCNDLVSIEGGE